jgi:hypothetical protein
MTDHNLKSSFSNGKLLAMKLDGTGTANLTGPDSNLASLTDNGTGDYTVTLNTALSEPPLVLTFPLTDDVTISQQTAPTTTVARFECRSIPVAEATATLSLDSAIKFHSQLSGVDGNDITIQMADAVTAGSEAIASVSDAGAIVINIEGGVSTAAQVHAAIMADSVLANEARNFITSEVLVGATAISTVGATALAGGVAPVPAAAVDAEFDILILAARAN